MQRVSKSIQGSHDFFIIMSRYSPVLGGSWVVLSGVRSPAIRVTSMVTLLIITPLITTHEPPSRP